MPYVRSCSASAASRSATATPTWSIRVRTRARPSERPIAATLPRCASRWSPTGPRAAGTDPEPLERAMRAHGAEVSACGCEAGGPRARPGRRARAARRRRRRRDGRRRSRSWPGGSACRSASSRPGPRTTSCARTGSRSTRSRPPCWPSRASALRRLELGRLGDGRPFVNVASAGLASVAARRAAPLKPRLGPLAYARRRAARRGDRRAAAVRRARRRRDRVRGRRLAGDRRRHGRVRRRLGASAPPTRRTACSTSPSSRPARALGLARRAWGLKRRTIAEQRGVEHHRGDVIEVDVPPGTEFNADGEVRDARAGARDGRARRLRAGRPAS